MQAMERIGFWILIAIISGALASFIAIIMSRHASKTETGVADVADGDDLEGSRGGNMLFLVAIFSILAFLIVWLVNAVMGRGLL